MDSSRPSTSGPSAPSNRAPDTAPSTTSEEPPATYTTKRPEHSATGSSASSAAVQENQAPYDEDTAWAHRREPQPKTCGLTRWSLGVSNLVGDAESHTSFTPLSGTPPKGGACQAWLGVKRDRRMKPLQGKGAVVTGGSRGIGAAIVQRLAADGATVVFSYARDHGSALWVEKSVRDRGGEATSVRIDLANKDSVDELMTFASHHLDGLDILVNNAALQFEPAPIAQMDDETFDSIMTVNATAVFRAIRHAATEMRDNGRIINISTLNTVRPAPGNSPYAASKGAVEQLTKVAAVELGERGITVNAVAPGATDTDLLRASNPPEALDRIARVTPMRRLGTPRDIADIVALLADPSSRWVTGQIIGANGGLG